MGKHKKETTYNVEAPGAVPVPYPTKGQAKKVAKQVQGAKVKKEK